MKDFSHPYDEQRLLLRELTRPTIQLVVVLKPRQIGYSTANAAHTFWVTYSAREPIKTLIATDCDKTSDALFAKIRTFNEELPYSLQRKLRRSTQREIIYDDTAAGIQCLMAGGKSKGKGFTYQRLIAEEMAFWDNAEFNWASLNAVLHEGPFKETVIISTPNGAGNLFHKQVIAAQAAQARGEPGVAFIFTPWSSHPTYQKAPPPDWRPNADEEALADRYALSLEQLYWRHQKIWAVDGIGADLFPTHYPLTVDEGFESPAGCWFDHDFLKSISAEMEPRYGHLKGEYRIYRKPATGERYAIGADPSWCDGSDEATAAVLDSRGRLAAVLAMSKGGEELYGERLADLAFAYGDRRRSARVLTESNKGGAGSVVIKTLKKRGVWLWTDPDRESPRFGKDWLNTNASNHEGYAHLRQMINGDALTLYDCLLLNQLKHIRQEDGTIEGRDGVPDDLADALMLAAWNLRTLPGATASPTSNQRRFRASSAFSPLKV